MQGFLGRPASSYQVTKYYGLAGFYRYAIARGLATFSPLPAQGPQPTQPWLPYVYSRDEIRRLLEATTTYRKRVCQLGPQLVQAMEKYAAQRKAAGLSQAADAGCATSF